MGTGWGCLLGLKECFWVRDLGLVGLVEGVFFGDTSHPSHGTPTSPGRTEAAQLMCRAEWFLAWPGAFVQAPLFGWLKEAEENPTLRGVFNF